MTRQIIVEGADQQGKTTICKILQEKLEWARVHYATPIPKDFDFHSDYFLPDNTISDRNFLSEMVYGEVLRGENRLVDIESLQDSMIAENYLLILADRREDFIFDSGRKEDFSLNQIRQVRRTYREAIKSIRIATLVVNPTSYEEVSKLLEIVGNMTKPLN